MNTKEKLMQLLELCIEKNLNFEYSPKHGLISVREYDINSNLLFNSETWNLNSGDELYTLEKIDKVIEEVKNYQP